MQNGRVANQTELLKVHVLYQNWSHGKIQQIEKSLCLENNHHQKTVHKKIWAS